jgi:uncharacterized membrane protein YbhN (UPF0104 family)
MQEKSSETQKRIEFSRPSRASRFLPFRRIGGSLSGHPSGLTARPMMRRWFSLAARIAVSAALLYYAFASVDLAELRSRLQDLNIAWMPLAVALALIQLVLLATRWRRIAGACGAPLSAGRSVRLVLISAFFNQVLPSTVGGDAMRLWLFARQGAGWSKATHSVLLDRFVGVLALALLVTACLPWSLALIRDPVGRTALGVISAVSLGGGLSFIALGLLPWPWLKRWPPLRQLTAMAVTARQILFSAAEAAAVLAPSFAIHALTAAIAWCAAQAIGASLGYFHALLLVPPVMLIATVPISVAGWGVREKSLVLAFAYAGLPEGDGLLIAVLLGITQLIVGLIGGMLWLGGGERSGARTAPREAAD